MSKLEKNALILIRRKLVSSRADIARMLGISRPTASAVVQRLISAGMIIECGKGKSNGGKTPIALAVKNDDTRLIGIDLGYSDRISAVLLDNSGSITGQKELEFIPRDLDELTGKTAELVREWAKTEKIAGCAVAVPGIVDEGTAFISRSINPLFCGDTLAEMLKEKLSMPLSVGNRSRMAAVSEAFGGAGDGERDFALISLGVSIGAAFWCGGGIFNGAGSAAGEIKNLRLACGRSFEEALAVPAVSGASPEEVAGLCADGLGQVVDIMDTRMLILSGRFADFGDGFAPLLEETMSVKHPVRVSSARYGRFSAARGAAFLLGETIIS